ncbi:MAG: hypothetical protein ACLPUO_04215 [Streptosporangiaceae bacterium]|jgi:hypothetical protein
MVSGNPAVMPAVAAEHIRDLRAEATAAGRARQARRARRGQPAAAEVIRIPRPRSATV